MDVRKIANPFLKELHMTTKEVVHLVILNNYDVVYIDKIESYQSININSSIGKVVPFHCTAVGKVLVSQKSKEDVIKALVSKGMNKYTDKSITDPDIFLKELDKVNRLGYAIDDNEYEIGIRCIAAPIKNHMGKIVAAISVAGFDSRITDERLADFVEMVAITAARISEKMGFDASIIL
ncbi:MAG TPA: IclR family transcriptional regulator, partial [Anaerovoracaceae bacterium]|nr:IclR family transcriptional regulator [Anaerovoracaceae bacterium]